MPPKAPDPRYAFVESVNSPNDLQPRHRLQLAGLAESSGFPLCSAPSSFPSSSSNKSPQKNCSARGKGMKGKGKGKGKADEDEIVEFSDSDVEVVGTKIACTVARCKEKNPSCLKHMGQEKWLKDEDKARSMFMKTPLLGENPMQQSRMPGVPVGLKLGATCYAAALLQTWFHNTRFRDAVYRLTSPANSEAVDSAKSPTLQLQTVFYGMQESQLLSFDPKGLIESLELYEDQQQDAQEFSKLFMSLLATEFAKQEDVDLKSLVEDQFEGDLSYVTTCQTCNTRSERESKFLELELTLQNNAPVEDRIKALLAKEYLTGNNQYRCSKCDSLQDAARQIELNTLPPILHFSLLRFVFDPETFNRKKSKSTIRFPPSINMGSFIAGSDKREDAWYDLRGVLLHKGGSAYSGHYCAEIYEEQSDQWFSCDDEVVTNIKPLTPSRNSRQYNSPDFQPPSSQASSSSRGEGKSTSPMNKIDSYMIKTPSSSKKRERVGEGTDRWSLSESTDEDEAAASKAHLKKLGLDERSKRSPDKSKKARLIDTLDDLLDSKTKPTKTKEERVPQYQTSRDAYMLVYSRRDPPSDSVPPRQAVSPPKEVQRIIEKINQKHTMKCESWEVKQVICQEAFEEILKEKNEIFDSWGVQSFDEPSYLVGSTALRSWVDLGLDVKPKKKPFESNEVQEVPDPSVDEAPPLPPPIDDAQPKSTEPIADAESSTHSTQDGVVPSSSSSLTIISEPADTSFDPVQFRQELMDAAKKMTFDQKDLLCEHGQIAPTHAGVLPFKRVSLAAYDQLKAHGCSFEPSLPVEAERICAECTLIAWKVETYKTQQPRRIETFKRKNKQEGEFEFIVTKKWKTDFLENAKAPEGPASATGPSPVDEPYRSDIYCVHGRVSPELHKSSSWISEPCYRYLQTIFQDLELPRSDEMACRECKEIDDEKQARARPNIEQARKEKFTLSDLIKNFVQTVERDKDSMDPAHCVDYSIIDAEFFRAWHRWVQNPVGSQRPCDAQPNDIVCEHGLLDFDSTNPVDRRNPRFTTITSVEWDAFAAYGYTMGARIELAHSEDDGVGIWRSNRPCCEPCRKQRLNASEKLDIRVQLIKLPGPSFDYCPTQSASPEKDARETSDSPPPRGSGSSKTYGKKKAFSSQTYGTRTSRRIKDKQEVETASKLVRFKGFLKTDTLKSVKLRLAKRFDTSVLYLQLRVNGQPVDDSSMTIQDAGILSGDTIECLQIAAPDEDDFGNLSDTVDDTPSSRRRNEANAGFGGTLLGGRKRPVAMEAQASLLDEALDGGEHAGSAPSFRLNGLSNGSATKKQKTRPAAPDVDPMDMIDLEDDSPSYTGPLACPACTFKNAAGMEACEMCGTPLR